MAKPSGTARSGRGRSATTGRFLTKTAESGRWLVRSRLGQPRDGGSSTRSANTGRYVSQAERSAAARARVSADKKRGVETESWIVALADADD